MAANNRLRVLRAERRLTQIDVARRMGVSQSTYWRIENGYDEPSGDQLARLARIFRVEGSELGFSEPSKTPAA